MGWNEGYRIFEATVIGAYDLGKLDAALLRVVMEPYRGTDIDRGGSRDLCTTDGKGVEQVVIETWGMTMPAAPRVAYEIDAEPWEAYHEMVSDLFRSVADHCGWG